MFPEGFGIHVTLAIITDKGDLQRGALTQPVAELYLLIFVPLSLFFFSFPSPPAHLIMTFC